MADKNRENEHIRETRDFRENNGAEGETAGVPAFFAKDIAGPGDREESSVPRELPGPGRQEAGGPGKGPEEPGLELFDLIYGVLFDPGRTFKKAAASPPLWQSVFIYAVINLLSGIMGIFIKLRVMPFGTLDLAVPVIQVVKGMIPLLAIGGFFMQFIKWFTYSALLHLIADFLGGKGSARGVFTVYGLAALPTLFLIPVQLLVIALDPRSILVNIILIPVSLALAIWGIILLVMGIREVHRLSTGRAIAVVLTPVLVMAVLAILTLIIIISFAASLPPLLRWPSL